MVVRKGGTEYFVECKRQERKGEYSEKERSEFLRLWDAAVPFLKANKQWVWLKATFHEEVSKLTTDFLAKILENSLPMKNREALVHQSDKATIHARLIDPRVVLNHLEQFQVKCPSPMLNSLLGGDWAPSNSEVTVIGCVKMGHVIDCEAPVLGGFVQEMAWASGITRKIDSEIAINKKARDITKLLSKAVEQVPVDKPSIIHIAAETLEGKDVELLRTNKVMSKISSFQIDRHVIGIRFHRLQSNSRADKLFEFYETVEKFQRAHVLHKDIPSQVIVPINKKRLVEDIGKLRIK